MKVIGLLMVFSLVLLACEPQEQEVVQQPEPTALVFTVDETPQEESNKYCVMTAFEGSGPEFHMASEVFSEPISCQTNDDCFQYLLTQDNYRRLASDFEKYLSCEEYKSKQVTLS